MNTFLKTNRETAHWGYFDAAREPVLTVESGSEVTIQTVSGGPDMLPGKGFYVPEELLDLHAAGAPTMPGHILTGPIAVNGAVPGDVLQVDILEVKLRQDWGLQYDPSAGWHFAARFSRTTQNHYSFGYRSRSGHDALGARAATYTIFWGDGGCAAG